MLVAQATITNSEQKTSGTPCRTGRFAEGEDGEVCAAVGLGGTVDTPSVFSANYRDVLLPCCGHWLSSGAQSSQDHQPVSRIGHSRSIARCCATLELPKWRRDSSGGKEVNGLDLDDRPQRATWQNVCAGRSGNSQGQYPSEQATETQRYDSSGSLTCTVTK